jgi:hypothetical protein
VHPVCLICVVYAPLFSFILLRPMILACSLSVCPFVFSHICISLLIFVRRPTRLPCCVSIYPSTSLLFVWTPSVSKG